MTRPASAVEPRNLTPNPFPSGKGNRTRAQEIGALPRTLERNVVRGISRFSYHWVQGSPLPKEVRNPRWVPRLIKLSLSHGLAGACSIACGMVRLRVRGYPKYHNRKFPGGREIPDLLTGLFGRNSKLSKLAPSK